MKHEIGVRSRFWLLPADVLHSDWLSKKIAPRYLRSLVNSSTLQFDLGPTKNIHMTMRKTGIALSLILACGACSPPSVPHSSSGQKMKYPIQSTVVFDRLSQNMLSNCKTADKVIESTCMAAMQKKIASCRTSSPVSFENEAEYKAVGKKYLACIMPRPICNGVEITTSEQMRQLCGKS